MGNTAKLTMPNLITIAGINAKAALLIGAACVAALVLFATGATGQRPPDQSHAGATPPSIPAFRWPTEPAADDGVISIKSLAGWPVVSALPKPDSMTDQVYAFRWGRDLRRSLPPEFLQRVATLAKQSDPSQDNPRSRVIASVLRGAISGTGPISPEVLTIRSWPDDLLGETQGFGAEDSQAAESIVSTSELHNLLAACNVYGTFSSEAAAVRLDGSIALLARWWTDDGHAPPLAIARRGAAVAITPVGIWAPLAGITGNGAAAIRIAPESPGRAYIPANGPDGVALMRYAMDGASIAGLDQQPGESSIGGLLIQYSNSSSTILLRHATPGIWLAADQNEGWRFEFRSGGGSEQSDGFEFKAMKAQPELARLREPSWSRREEVDVSRLFASGQYRAPELADPSQSGPTGIEQELDQFGPGDQSWPRLSRWLQDSATGELRVILLPRTGELVIFDPESGLVRLRGE